MTCALAGLAFFCVIGCAFSSPSAPALRSNDISRQIEAMDVKLDSYVVDQWLDSAEREALSVVEVWPREDDLKVEEDGADELYDVVLPASQAYLTFKDEGLEDDAKDVLKQLAECYTDPEKTLDIIKDVFEKANSSPKDPWDLALKILASLAPKKLKAAVPAAKKMAALAAKAKKVSKKVTKAAAVPKGLVLFSKFLKPLKKTAPLFISLIAAATKKIAWSDLVKKYPDLDFDPTNIMEKLALKFLGIENIKTFEKEIGHFLAVAVVGSLLLKKAGVAAKTLSVEAKKKILLFAVVALKKGALAAKKMATMFKVGLLLKGILTKLLLTKSLIAFLKLAIPAKKAAAVKLPLLAKTLGAFLTLLKWLDKFLQEPGKVDGKEAKDALEFLKKIILPGVIGEDKVGTEGKEVGDLILKSFPDAPMLLHEMSELHEEAEYVAREQLDTVPGWADVTLKEIEEKNPMFKDVKKVLNSEFQAQLESYLSTF